MLLLSMGSLLQTGELVLERVEQAPEAEAREALSWLVSRDTSAMDRPLMRKTLADTLSENLTDAFTAPFFWLLVGGPVALWCYKAVSTTDSMWGYMTEKWRWLGWAVVPSLYLLLMAAPRQWSWPVARFVREYRWYAAVPVALWMFGWFWLVNAFSDGSAEPLPYLPLPKEANPFLGERGLRMTLRRPQLLRQQLSALLKAADGRPLRIMFPMVGRLEEWHAAKAILDEVLAKTPCENLQVGVMIEVPSAALIAGHLAAEVDFFSIGTNDLTQYVLAIDRGHPILSAEADGLHPSILQLISHTVAAAHRHGKWVGVCGELAADSKAVPILLGLGVDELSVSSGSIPMVKAQVRRLNAQTCRQMAEEALTLATAGEVRSLAQRSAEAAREVKALIDDSVSKAEAGNQQAAQAGQAMQDIVAGIQRVASIVDEIALASREQAAGLTQINQAVAHLDGVTQQNAALVEQTSAAASALQDQASYLAGLANTFQLQAQHPQAVAAPALGRS